MSILAVGTVALDSVRTPFGARREILGGSATFFSFAASFFNRVDIIAVVGNDFPCKYVRLFNKRRIGTEGLSTVRGKTFRWEGYYGSDPNTAHTLSTCLNVFERFNPVIPEGLKSSRFLFLANADPELQRRVMVQARTPDIIAADSMNYWIDNKRKSLERLLGKVDIFLVNDAEARQLSREANIMKAAAYIRSLGPKAVIVKRGEYGVKYFSKTDFFVAPAYPLENVRDTTGAGDSFAGGLMGYLSTVRRINDAAMRKAIVYGSMLASFAVEDFSINRLLRISRRDIKTRYKRYKEMTEF